MAVTAEAKKETVPKTEAKEGRKVADRWTEALAKDGWTPIATCFLKQYALLSPPLTTPEAMFVIQLMVHKWSAQHPYPAFKTMAKRMGVTAQALRNHARSLEKKKYLRRVMRIGRTNKFNLTPLFEALEAKLKDEQSKMVKPKAN